MLLGDCVAILEEASWRLKILDPERSELWAEDLIDSVEAERVKLSRGYRGTLFTQKVPAP